jgi:ABC-type cobalamin/Fe3+-siderophores transport system ATPase subunit
MNFIDTLTAVELVIESGEVPLIIGESGIGKTALIKKLCKKNNYYNITIDGNMLKEGEIGGLPTVEEYSVIIDGQEVKRKRTIYAVHTKLQEIDQIVAKEPEKLILLFIDEINRCEHTVQQELMNIILNREINNYRLPKNIIVAAAMNPSNKYDEFTNSDYQVVDMDAAQENRFVWLSMESDINSWLDWGIKEGNIHEDVLEFLSSFSNNLHTPNSTDTVKATPRSWERVSKAYRVYLEKKNEIPARVFQAVLKGNVGVSIAQEFYGFIENNKNPLIKPMEIFKGDRLDNELIMKVKKETHSRLYMTAKNVINYINNLEYRKKEIKLFIEFLNHYPTDLKLAIMKELKQDYGNSVYNDFILEEDFIESFFKIYN